MNELTLQFHLQLPFTLISRIFFFIENMSEECTRMWRKFWGYTVGTSQLEDLCLLKGCYRRIRTNSCRIFWYGTAVRYTEYAFCVSKVTTFLRGCFRIQEWPASEKSCKTIASKVKKAVVQRSEVAMYYALLKFPFFIESFFATSINSNIFHSFLQHYPTG